MIKKIPTTSFIDPDTDKTEVCGICKMVNIIPCDHKARPFRRRDRFDNLIETVNEIVDYLNKK